MNQRRLSSAPELPGFEFIDFIGSGGYADVFLYEQTSPRRRVAVKIVDTAALDTGSASDYTAEANVMAMVSAHPHIVQVFQASVSPDGRPFLVMEYYPNKNFHQRSRTEQMSVPEVLRVGIQIASAVETAHRAGILHRDIKPANILTSEFSHPGLTDFGIAAVAGQADLSGDGLSIPWSPPEALGESPTLAQSDVYSLAATLYTMLAGRAPFEIKGGDNRPLAVMSRIERDPVPPVGRPDVPVLLERVLAGAMAKNPLARPATAADLARQLQEVESSMQLPVTPLQLRDDGPRVRSRGVHDADATRVKNITSIDPHATTRPPVLPSSPRDRLTVVSPISTLRTVAHTTTVPQPTEPDTLRIAQPAGASTVVASTLVTPTVLEGTPTGAAPAVPGRRREGLLAEPEVADTITRAPTSTTGLSEYEAPKALPKLWLGITAAAVAVIAVVVAVQLLSGGKPSKKVDDGFNQTEAQVAEVNDNLSAGVHGATAVAPLPVEEVMGKPSETGSNHFTWKNPGNGVTFSVTVDGQESSTELDTNEFTTVGQCIQVEVVAPSGLVSPPVRGCVS